MQLLLAKKLLGGAAVKGGSLAAGTYATGAATTGAAGVGAAGAVPGIEIFGGVTVFGVGGVPPFGAPETGALVLLDWGLFWKWVIHSGGTEVGSA